MEKVWKKDKPALPKQWVLYSRGNNNTKRAQGDELNNPGPLVNFWWLFRMRSR
jgi:hypothetical protein